MGGADLGRGAQGQIGCGRVMRVWLAASLCALVLFAIACATATQSAQATGRISRALSLAAVQDSSTTTPVRYLHRDYTVTILHNGDIHIAEHWQVQFAGQSFHHAFVYLYLARTAGIDVGTVTGDSPTNQQVTETTDAAGNPVRQVAWDFPPTSATQASTRSFNIPYTVHGGLGIGSPASWLDWHFLDGGSTETFPVDSSTVTVTLPGPVAESDMQVYSADADAQPLVTHPDATTVRFSATNLVASHPFEIEVTFPNTLVNADVQRQPWQVGDTPPQIPTALGATSDGGGQGGSQPDGSLPGGTYYGGPGPGAGVPSVMSGLASLIGCGLVPLIAVAGLILGLARRSTVGSAPDAPGAPGMYVHRRGWMGGPWVGPWGGPWGGGGGFRGGSFGGGGFGGGGFGGGGFGGGFGGGGGMGGGGGGGGSGFS